MEEGRLALLLGGGFAAFSLGAGVSVVPGVRASLALRLAHGLSALGAVAMAAGAAAVLLTGRTLDLGRFPLLPGVGGASFRMDALSAFFTLLISAPGAAASLYACGYTAGDSQFHAPSPAVLGSMWNLFIASMVAVVLAADGLSFLFMWELMSVVSFLLVLADHQDREVRQAGYFYLVMTHLGTAFLFAAFLALYAHSGSLDFAAIRAAVPALPARVRGVLFCLVCTGFGTKAGMVPVHVWLPRAHPAAPSHVSALMSGAMVKTALYGMLRFLFDVLGGGPPWWGRTLLIVGGISALTGVLYATQQSHLKRLLAYSTVENIGLLCMGTGAALLARAIGWPALAAMALAAVLFHAMSHAAFKGLAFMGAGAVLRGTGTVDMERLGGLIRRMPGSAALCLLAAIGIAGLPPLSGFIGEWLLLHAFVRLAGAGQGMADRLGALGAVGVIGLAAGLGAVAALKQFGIPFLALPRSVQAEQAREANGTMRAGMAVLAAAVVGLGFFPGAVLRLATPAVAGLIPGTDPGRLIPGGPVTGLAVWPAVPAGVRAELQPVAVPFALITLAVLMLALTLVMGRGWPRWRRGMTWTCGIRPDARMEYSGAGYTKPVLLMFRSLLQPVRTVQVHRPGHPLFPGRLYYRSDLKAIFEMYLYRPVTRSLMAVATRLRRVQTGSLQTYLLYLLVTAVALIVAAR